MASTTSSGSGHHSGSARGGGSEALATHGEGLPVDVDVDVGPAREALLGEGRVERLGPRSPDRPAGASSSGPQKLGPPKNRVTMIADIVTVSVDIDDVRIG